MKKTHTKIKTIGKLLKTARMQSGLSQVDVSKILGHATGQYISNFERGLNAPSVETVIKLVKIYRLDPKATYRFMVDEYSQALWKQMNSHR